MYKVERCLLLDLLYKADMSQKQLADRVGISKQQINAYANNRQIMNYQTAFNIASVLDCDMAALYKMSLANKE